MSLKTRLSVFNFWEIIAFFANSIAFLYLGISMNIVNIAQGFPLIALSFGAELLVRIGSTYPILAAVNRFTKGKDSYGLEAHSCAWWNARSNISSPCCITA